VPRVARSRTPDPAVTWEPGPELPGGLSVTAGVCDESPTPSVAESRLQQRGPERVPLRFGPGLPWPGASADKQLSDLGAASAQMLAGVSAGPPRHPSAEVEAPALGPCPAPRSLRVQPTDITSGPGHGPASSPCALETWGGAAGLRCPWLPGVGMGSRQRSSPGAALSPREERSLLHHLKCPETDQGTEARNGKARDGEKQLLKYREALPGPQWRSEGWSTSPARTG